jgi:hypothetical protein
LRRLAHRDRGAGGTRMYQGGTKLIDQSQQSPANLEYVNQCKTNLFD